MVDLRETFGECPDAISASYASEWLKHQRRPRTLPLPSMNFYYRGPQCTVIPLSEPGLWLPLSCAIAVANSGAAHVAVGGTGNTSAINCTGATFLVAYVCELATATAVHDSSSNTWTDLATYTGDFSSIARIAYAANPTVTSSQTFNVSGGTVPSICVIAFTGVSLTSPYDGQFNGVSSDNPPTTQVGFVLPANNDSLIITGIGGANALTPITIDSGFTVTDQINLSAGNWFSTAIAYLVQSGSPSGVNPIWTWSGGFNGPASDGCFKPTAAAGTRINLLSALGAGQ